MRVAWALVESAPPMTTVKSCCYHHPYCYEYCRSCIICHGRREFDINHSLPLSFSPSLQSHSFTVGSYDTRTYWGTVGDWRLAMASAQDAGLSSTNPPLSPSDRSSVRINVSGTRYAVGECFHYYYCVGVSEKWR